MDAHSREAEIRARLAEISGGEPGPAERALLGRLIRSYLAKTPAAVDRLGELLRDGSPDDVRDHAHALKGSAANLGADTLAGVFAEVEHAARNGEKPGPDLTLRRVETELLVVQDLFGGLIAEFDQ
jgi:histidine phosphotransfer protein HptB